MSYWAGTHTPPPQSLVQVHRPVPGSHPHDDGTHWTRVSHTIPAPHPVRRQPAGLAPHAAGPPPTIPGSTAGAPITAGEAP